MTQVVAFSGGKDSTAMVCEMAERGETGTLLFTPTQNELGAVREHIDAVAARVGWPLVVPATRSLVDWMTDYNALPNNRQRWCTRQIKIVPCIAYLRSFPEPPVLCVGLRADEPLRSGLYGEWATYRYPLREWGWGIGQVWESLRSRQVVVPGRTDWAWCYDQRLGDWYRLWRDHPQLWAEACGWEERTGHTFRSASRDSWPAALGELAARFTAGQVPTGEVAPGDPVQAGFAFYEDEAAGGACRVCRL